MSNTNIHEDIAAALEKHGAVAVIEALRDAVDALGTHATGTFAGAATVREAQQVSEWLTAAANGTARVEAWTTRRLGVDVSDANGVMGDALAAEE
jgi:hypothetical protein